MTTPVDEKRFPDLDRPLRAHDRVAGPFDGRWVAALSVAVRIHDLSVGGCLIEAHHHQPAGRRLTLDIDLPFEGTVRVEGETVYARPDYGFAVQFKDVTVETLERLTRVVDRLKSGPLAR